METLRRIKEIDKDAVCLMVTRITDKRPIEESRSYGALTYLKKPLDLEDIEDAVEKAKAYIKS